MLSGTGWFETRHAPTKERIRPKLFKEVPNTTLCCSSSPKSTPHVLVLSDTYCTVKRTPCNLHQFDLQLPRTFIFTTKFQSGLLYGQPFSSYRTFWDKCTEWPETDLNAKGSKAPHPHFTTTPDPMHMLQLSPIIHMLQLSPTPSTCYNYPRPSTCYNYPRPSTCYNYPRPHPHVTTLPDHPHVTTIPDHPHVTTIPAHPHVTTIPAHPHVTTIPDHPHVTTIPDPIHMLQLSPPPYTCYNYPRPYTHVTTISPTPYTWLSPSPYLHSISLYD